MLDLHSGALTKGNPITLTLPITLTVALTLTSWLQLTMVRVMFIKRWAHGGHFVFVFICDNWRGDSVLRS